jgi:transglutaminase/protease-like cytokinesis protein 3
MVTLKYKFFLVFFLLVSTLSQGQIGAVIDNNIYTSSNLAKKNTTTTTRILAQNITKNCHTDLQKVTAIYLWIAKNISYDYELFSNQKLQKEFYISEKNVIKKTLERRKGVCSGYAYLFKELCENVGVTSEIVHGYTKKYTTGQKNNKVNHTWNVVNIDGSWKLLDITWASREDNSNLLNSFWFFTSPKDFIYSHYPEEKKWTLLKNPITKNEFDTLSK